MKLDLNKAFPFLAVFLVLTMGYFGGWWDDFFKFSADKETLKPAIPSIDMSRTRLIGWEKGQRSWEIEAQRIWQSADGNLIYFQKIDKGVVFSVKDKQVVFKAGWARWEKLREQLFLGGELEAKVEDGTIVTEEAIMNYRTEEMVCSKEIRYSKNDIWASAKTMKLNFKKEEMLLEGDVELIQKKDQIKAAGIIYNFKNEDYQIVTPTEVIVNP